MANPQGMSSGKVPSLSPRPLIRRLPKYPTPNKPNAIKNTGFRYTARDRTKPRTNGQCASNGSFILAILLALYYGAEPGIASVYSGLGVHVGIAAKDTYVETFQLLF